MRSQGSGIGLAKNASSEPLMLAQQQQQHPEPVASLELRLSVIDGGDEDGEESGQPGARLASTPSVRRDLAAGVPRPQAARQQRYRAQLRLIDVELVEARAELQRRTALRGPTGVRHECDGDCIVGGCAEEFAQEQGVLCSGCQLFLCYPCFGSTVVANECVGGRYSSELHGATDGADGSPWGSLPCPLFPQGCSIGHVPLAEIQRALLHPGNRGVDGDAEDVSSPGTSPHKIHLIARRQQAEKLLWASDIAGADDGGGWKREIVPAFLLRTVTQNAVTAALGRTVSSTLRGTESKARAALGDKHSELVNQAEYHVHPHHNLDFQGSLRDRMWHSPSQLDFQGRFSERVHVVAGGTAEALDTLSEAPPPVARYTFYA